jgi:hypothetical protein
LSRVGVVEESPARRANAGEGTVEVPAPTSWPLIAAFGVSLAFAGLVTNAIVSAAGIVLALVGAVGWFRDVLPEERCEAVPLRPPAQRAGAVVAAPLAVEHLKIGEAGHRVRIPAEIHPYSAGVKGGLAGAVAMAIAAEVYGLFAQKSLWYPINLLAAAAMPSLANAGLETLVRFDGAAFGVAVVVHGVMSVFVGLLYAVILPMLPRRTTMWGGVVAPVLWSGLVWASLGVINPVLDARIDWPWFVLSQIVFGLTAGIVIARTERIATMQSWPLAARAGIESPGVGPGRGDREKP